MGKYLRERVV